MSLLKYTGTYKPFSHAWAMDLAVEHEKIHWIEDEADLSEDIAQWKGNKLTEDEKQHITFILRLFTQSDTAVGHNYINHFLSYFKNNEVRCMLLAFAAREGTHQRAYALLNDSLGLPDSEYEEFLKYEEMKATIDLAQELDMSTHKNVLFSLVREIIVEGVGLFGQFAMLLNYQRFGKMKGMGTIVEWSIRDESAHVEGLCRLFTEYVNEFPGELTQSLMTKIIDGVKELVDAEISFCKLVFDRANHSIEGITFEETSKYLKFLTNKWLLTIGLWKIYDQEDNPLQWVDWIVNGADHSNFFEKRVTEYASGGMTDSWGWDNIFPKA